MADDFDPPIEEIKTLNLNDLRGSLLRVASKVNEVVRSSNKHHGKPPQIINIQAGLQMNNKTNSFESSWLRYVFNPAIVVDRPTALFLALFTSNPGETGSVVGEVAAGVGYNRIPCTFADPILGATQNGVDLAFPTSTAAWGLVTHVGVCLGSVRGVADLIYYGPLVASINVNASGIVPRFVAGTLTVSEKTVFAGLAGNAQGNATMIGDGTTSGSSPMAFPALDFDRPAGINLDGTGTVMNTTFPIVTGTSWACSTNTQVQNALANAQYGDEIVLQAGVDFTAFVLPAKSGFLPGKWILIRSSRLSEIPQNFYSIKAAFAASKMARVRGNAINVPTIYPDRAAKGWWIAGINADHPVNADLQNAMISTKPQNGLAGDTNNHSEYIVLDRIYITEKTQGCRRGVQLSGRNHAVLYSLIDGMYDPAFNDSQAIASWDGPGPFKIIGCGLEAASENILWGGSGPEIATEYPGDIEVRSCLLFKRQAWLNNLGQYNIKNIFEIKDGRRVLVEGCVFHGMRRDSQYQCIIHQSLNEDGAGHAAFNFAQDAHYRFNKFFNVVSIFNIGSLSGPSSFPSVNGSQRIQFNHNAQMDQMFDDGDLEFFLAAGNAERPMPGLHFNNNFMQSIGYLIYFTDGSTGRIKADFKFNNNVNIGPTMRFAAISGDGGSLNDTALNNFTGPGNWEFKRNVVINGLLGQGSGVLLTAPHSNKDFSNLSQLQLVGGSNFRFAASSPCKNIGTDGNDPGPDWNTLDTLTSWYQGLP